MSENSKFQARIVSRKRFLLETSSSTYRCVTLAMQVISSEGVEKGTVMAEHFNEYYVPEQVMNALWLARKGHVLTVPYVKQPGKALQISKKEIEFDLESVRARLRGEGAKAGLFLNRVMTKANLVSIHAFPTLFS